MEGDIVLQLFRTRNTPLSSKWWNDYKEKIDLNKRLNFHLNKNEFDKFKNHFKRKRFNRAYNYYLNSFYECSISSAFCLLCSAVDAITGTGKSGLTKKRLAKYSSYCFANHCKLRKMRK